MQYQVEKANSEAQSRLKNAQKYYRAKQFLEAALEARAGLHAWPDDGALVTGDLKAQLGYCLATSLMFEGDLKEAADEAQKVRQIPAKQYTVDVLNAVTQAETLRRLNQKAEACEVGECALKKIKKHNEGLVLKGSESEPHKVHSVKGVGAHADLQLDPSTRITEEICAYLHVIVAEGYMKDKQYLTACKVIRDGLAREEKIEEDTRAALYKLLAQCLHLSDADKSYFGF